jgi:hypothetical protein
VASETTLAFVADSPPPQRVTSSYVALRNGKRERRMCAIVSRSSPPHLRESRGEIFSNVLDRLCAWTAFVLRGQEDLLSGFKRRPGGVSMPVSCLYLRSIARRICASGCLSKRDLNHIFGEVLTIIDCQSSILSWTLIK